jgi:hypothetical protein
MRLAELVERFEPELRQRHGDRLSRDMQRALRAWRACRGPDAAQIDCRCETCASQTALPQSCGHRACPHCQQGCSEDWLDQQRRLRLPVDYFLLTFTLPARLRGLARCHPRRVYAALLQCAWQTLAQFARRGRGVELGATAVLHTHNRRRDLHPHVHLIVPGGGVNPKTGRWTSKRRYLFNTRALARVFRARLLQRLRADGLQLPPNVRKQWVAHCACVGDGEKALGYLARYLYRGVLSETDILDVTDGKVRFRYRDAESGETRIRRLPGADFLWLLLGHVLPRGFRRTRSYGLLHHRRKVLLARIQLMLRVVLPPATEKTQRVLLCRHCGQPLRVLGRRLPAGSRIGSAAPVNAEGNGAV